MDGFDIFNAAGIVFALLAFILALGIAYVTYRSVRKAVVSIQNSHQGPVRNAPLAWFSILFTSAGLFYAAAAISSFFDSHFYYAYKAHGNSRTLFFNLLYALPFFVLAWFLSELIKVRSHKK